MVGQLSGDEGETLRKSKDSSWGLAWRSSLLDWDSEVRCFHSSVPALLPLHPGLGGHPTLQPARISPQRLSCIHAILLIAPREATKQPTSPLAHRFQGSPVHGTSGCTPGASCPLPPPRPAAPTIQQALGTQNPHWAFSLVQTCPLGPQRECPLTLGILACP